MNSSLETFFASRTVVSFACFAFYLGVANVACSSASTPPGSAGSGSSGGGGTTSGGGSGSGASSGNVGGTSSGTTNSSSGAVASGSSGGGSSTGGSSGGSGASSSGGAGSSSGADAAVVSGPYPSGPYCTPAGPTGHLAVGCVLPDVSWIGYDDEGANAVATMEPYATYTLDAARKSGKRYAMINVAEFLCPGCANSATELGAVGDGGVSAGASVVKAGGVVIEVLETSGFQATASKTNLDSWVNKYSLMVTTVKDPDGPGGMLPASPSLALFGRRDQAYIVDLTTMKITQFFPGNIGSASDNSAGVAMAAMHTLLGK